MNAPTKPFPLGLTLLIVSALLLSSALVVAPVSAASIVVNSNADVMVDDGLCTLREAIYNANENTRRYDTDGECAAGSDGLNTITFADNYTITLDGGGGRLLITSTISIIGLGAANTIIQATECNPVVDVDCSHDHRVITVEKPGILTLDGVTVRHGNISGGGGGIKNDVEGIVHIINSVITANQATLGGGIHNEINSNLTIINSLIVENKASQIGGAIFNQYSVSITNSNLLNNKADWDGGGIYNLDGDLTVTGSTLANNSAISGGGGFYNVGDAWLTNSTLSGNNAEEQGGAILNAVIKLKNDTYYGFLNINNVTISGNSADVGGGLYLQSVYLENSILNFANTIIANSTGGDCITTASANISTNVNNLIEDGSCGGTTGNPKLGPLADNGGPTHTHALLPGSKAIDAGDPATCAAEPVHNIDQRSIARPQGAACDIGAFELELSYGELKITKIFDPLTSGFTGTFALHIDCGIAHSETVNLVGGESKTISDIPIGTTCSVTEPELPTAPAGWTFGEPAFDPPDGTVTIGSTIAEVTVTNTISIYRIFLPLILVGGSP